GTPPFPAGTPVEILRQVMDKEPRRPRHSNPRVDKDLDTICLKCLEKDPARRYATAEALANDLEHWLRQEPIHARPAGLGLRTRRWIARNRLATALIFSVAIGM